MVYSDTENPRSCLLVQTISVRVKDSESNAPTCNKRVDFSFERHMREFLRISEIL